MTTLDTFDSSRLTDDIRLKKRNFLRYNEYYGTQETFDNLYNRSSNGQTFKNLIKHIADRKNILLAYRTIKSNSGSTTPGVNGHTIRDWKERSADEYVSYIQRRLRNYVPHPVKRVFIPKANGKLRPLGIPTIEDRLVQQCIKQVLEPICEAKFHPYSFGFRPNRSTEHAISHFSRLVNVSKLHYVVDIDIKGFFDNVNHGKLMKQLWTLGIRDKNLLCVISKLLKAEIVGEGIPTMGTPQGGVLSPLLSNIVLNELDWWVSNQWETFKTRTNYKTTKKNGHKDTSSKYKALRKTRLKEFHIVRYADDFKLVCRDLKTARIMYQATKAWLQERLGLEISEEKSKITKITQSSSEFLGLTFKANRKKNKHVLHSRMSKKAFINCQRKLTELVKTIQKHPTPQNVNKYNAAVLGIQNYYKIATHVNLDMTKIGFLLSHTIRSRLSMIMAKSGCVSKTYKKFYKNNFKRIFVKNVALFPIGDVQHKSPLGFNQKICLYTDIGRKPIHDNLKNFDMGTLHYLMKNPIPNMSVEYNDNRLSLYIAQYGKCGVSGEDLFIGDMECHHKTPRQHGGDDSYKNLIYVNTRVHKLIHATDANTIAKYIKLLRLDDQAILKLNKLRILVGNSEIS
ncbi:MULTISPECIES: group II intron reverse transcriptase/maturase [Bacillota]|nr:MULTISPECIES: group II intron reverse transcriptase/maturase [Bacillota]MDA2666346.1 group II intron reverse transcriptase/maturase [Bacillus cereus group sp. Bc032]MDA2677075.1 group II intron reverse transcriptase/maturase [Bacillus cereus group sp. Bc031]MDA2682573.1 group II intron reverse transcriptase/maturase [Bacillus cereus group sp. Bc029]MDA2688013.1 group II intron reverse transcriptase/maturase [Bacillus cereus group sp. Bc030]MDA2743521.1 group II intron reverse transcriptase/